jgi:hypothetical protein
MNISFWKKYKKLCLAIVLLVLVVVFGRLYYRVTDGFLVRNTTSDLAYNEKWETTPLSPQEQPLLDSILSQKFRYLGKGCQSYVFLSEDKNYVLKFLKYQRFRPQPWIVPLSHVPFIKGYCLRNIEKKNKKLTMLFDSWKNAFEELRPETGLVYVHLNKSKDLGKILTIYDKLGFEHHVNVDEMEFLIQKRAQMLCPTIDKMMTQNDVDGSKELITRLLNLVLSEYERGLADNDHALMQNTGVYEGFPIHIDVGQFVHNEMIKNPEVYKQELFSKTFKFRKWLNRQYPELASFLEEKLLKIIGERFHEMKPQVKNHAWSE